MNDLDPVAEPGPVHSLSGDTDSGRVNFHAEKTSVGQASLRAVSLHFRVN